MAERRQHHNRKSEASDENINLKKRSRSEGPHGRRRVRNSVHETSNKSTEFKSSSNGRHSMYTGHLSDDDDIRGVHSGSDSPDSDIASQQWTKNPLMVRKSRKAERVSKTEKRRSAHNMENQKSGIELDGQRSNQKRETGEYLRKYDHSPVSSHKAKFQRMEENRKKRIDMAVTSDEECSPQLRISRLRQRAMMSSQNVDPDYGHDVGLHIVPKRGESSFQAYRDLKTGSSQGIQNGQAWFSQYDESLLGKYDENFNVDNKNGNFHQEYSQGARHAKLPNVLPEFLPENRQRIDQPVSKNEHTPRNSTTRNQVTSLVHQELEKQIPSVPSKQIPQRSVKVSSESPKLRSFNEVKSKQPSQLKQANQRIELGQRSPDSSSDSLDDLIESNIQYLESEIESGKLKRQSGNYSKYTPEKVVQQKLVREPLRIQQVIPVQNDFRSRLQDPRSFVSNKLTSTVTTVSPKIVQKTSLYPEPGVSYAPAVKKQQSSEPRNIPISGSATYSPYTQRKMAHVVNEDLSKSDSHLNAMNSNSLESTNAFQNNRGYIPYPVLNKQTGNVKYVQPNDRITVDVDMSDTKPVVDSGMFSDVEYDIEVSERIKKWEKKLTPGELEEKHKVLNTIREYESFSDSNQKDSVPDTPVEVRREIWQLLSPTSNSGVGKLSVNLARSTSSMSDSNTQEPNSSLYYEPKVVSSETNLHRIFRVVNEPRPRRTRVADINKPVAQSHDATVHSRNKKPAEVAGHTHSMSNVTLSESEMGSNMQQSWPPMAVDSDSGVRKSWRMSRYEEEINELKELVSDSVRDIRRKFDSDVSETDTKRASSPVAQPRHTTSPVVHSIPVMPVQPQTASGTSKLTLSIQPVTPTNQRSPVTIRRKLADQPVEVAPPVVSARLEKKLPVYRNIPVDAKSVSNMQAVAPPLQTTITEIKPPLTSESIKLSKTDTSSQVSAPDVWSPNLESRKGLVSMERVKARTLQTIPFSEDPVWKEIEGLATFDKQEEVSKDVNFDEIDELLKIATGGVDSLKNRPSRTDNLANRMTTSDVVVSPATSKSRMTHSYYTPSQSQLPLDKQKAVTDSSFQGTVSSKHVFNPPVIQPLKLNSKPAKKSSTSALDEVLEDIRASLQKKPLSPKLMKNIDTSESNSSTNLSLQSPLTKSAKSFNFPQEVKKVQPEIPAKPKFEIVRSSSATPGYDNTQSSWKPAQHDVVPQNLHLANVPYIDPEFTQFPYIINGNYHLDPKLLSEKLKSTGLANDSSDEVSANQRADTFSLPANHQAMNGFHEPASQAKQPSATNSVTYELDQSVDDLRTLAQEVEFKLSQIKSRIVSADELRLDNILLALRKFAPMTEQTFFNVKFTPNFESEKARRSKLEDALSELEKMYECLELDDKSMLDRATLREETMGYDGSNLQRRHSDKGSSSSHLKYERSNSVELCQGASSVPKNDNKILRRSQIDEIEKQTQNEFEDITKSFQVLLDEVTRQCRNVAQDSSRYSASDSSLFSETTSQFSGQRPTDEVRLEPPRQQLKLESQSQRALQDSYNTAIKELEFVAMGNTSSSSSDKNKSDQPVQSVMYLNIDKSKADASGNRNVSSVSPTRNIDIQVKSFSAKNNKSKPSVTMATGSTKFVSMATEFHKPVVVTSIPQNKADMNKNVVSLQVDLDNIKPKGHLRERGEGRFRRRGNIEHRKSMPAITRSVETQTVETQTESSPPVTEMKANYENKRKSSLQDESREFTKNDQASPKMSGQSSTNSSSDEEFPENLTKSKMRRSLSCPDIVALLEEFNRKESEKEKRKAKASLKSVTPKSVKQRHVNKSRFRSLQSKGEPSEMSTSITSDDGMEVPLNKPPVYPVWKYPGQVDVPSSKKNETKKHVEKEVTRALSDSEQVVFRVPEIGTVNSETVVRRRTRSFGYEEDIEERPKSFHELVATFEQNPQRLEKIKMIGLRKCASEDSMFTDLILQKMYRSESDLQKMNKNSIKLTMEKKETS